MRHSFQLRPQFDQISYKTRVKENVPVGTVVEQMNAFLPVDENFDVDREYSIIYFMHETERPITSQRFKVKLFFVTDVVKLLFKILADR